MLRRKNNSRRVKKTRRSPKKTSNGRQTKFGGDFVPARLRTSLRVEGTIENAATATYAEAGFTINGMFDPQGGSGAAQCPGFDQLALLYNRYRVHASRCQVRASLNSTSGTPTATAMEARLVVYPSTVATAAATLADGESQPFAKTYFMSGEKPTNITETCHVAKFIGNTTSADRLQALVTANPASVLIWHIGTISRAYTNAVTTIDIIISYDVEFFERNLLDRGTVFAIHEAKKIADKVRLEVAAELPNFINLKSEQKEIQKTEEKSPVNEEDTVFVNPFKLALSKTLKPDAAKSISRVK